MLKRTKLTAAEVASAAEAYLEKVALDPYVVAARSRGMLEAGAGARTLSILAAAGQKHSDDVCRTDGPYFGEAAAVVAARAEVERVSGGAPVRAKSARYRGDTGEIQGRYRGDTWEIQGRYRGDTWEIHGRYRRDIGLRRG